MTAYNELHKKEDMIGLHFHKWTVLEYSHKHERSGNWYYLCRCDCGNEAAVKGSSLRNGISKQCKQCSGKVNGRKGIYAQNEGTDLYFIRCLQFVKIGTTANLSERLRTIKSSNPFDLNLEYYGVEEGYREEYWHNVFKDKLHQGEWYWLTNEDIEKVKQFKGDLGCKDCPMCHYYQEQGYSSYECIHPNSSKRGYEASINNNKDTPSWCPLKESK